MSRARCTVKNNGLANYRAAATHARKTAEAIVRTLELLPESDPRRARLRAIAEQMTSAVEAFYRDEAARTLEDAQALRRLVAAQRREVAAIRAEVLTKHGGICLVHESADLDSDKTLYHTCDECRARYQAGVLRRAGFPTAAYQRLN